MGTGIVDKFLQSDKFKALSPDEQQVKINSVVLDKIAALPQFTKMEETSRITQLEGIRQELHQKIGEGLYGSSDAFDQAAVEASKKKEAVIANGLTDQTSAIDQLGPTKLNAIKQEQPIDGAFDFMSPALNIVRPFGVAEAAAVAPIGYDYQTKGLINGAGEALGVAYNAAKGELFPKFNAPRPNYEGAAIDKMFPNMNETWKPAASLALGILADPTIITLPFAGSIRKGLAVSAMTKTEAGPWTTALRDMMSYVPMKHEELSSMTTLARQADTGDKVAAEAMSNQALDMQTKIPNLAEDVKAQLAAKVEATKLPQDYFNQKFLNEAKPEWAVPQHITMTAKGELADPVLNAVVPKVRENEYTIYHISSNGKLGITSPEMSTEGFGHYGFLDKTDAEVFKSGGAILSKHKIKLEKPFVTTEPTYVLNESELLFEPIKPTDPPFLKLNKQAARSGGIQEGAHGEYIDTGRQGALLTLLLKEKGYDGIIVKEPGAQQWIVKLDVKSAREYITNKGLYPAETAKNIWQRETYKTKALANEAKKALRAADSEVPALKIVSATEGKGWKLESKELSSVKPAEPQVTIESVKLGSGSVENPVILKEPVPAFSEPLKETIQARYSKKLNAIHDVYSEAVSAFHRPDNPLPALEKFDNFMEDIHFGMNDLLERKLINQEEATKLVDNITPNFLKEFMKSPTKELMHKALSGLEISGLTASEKALIHIRGQAGFVDQHLIRELGLQASSSLLGFGTDTEGNVSWSMDNWINHGGPILSGLSIGRLAYRRVGAANVIKQFGGRISGKIWELLDHVPPLKYLAESFHPTERTNPKTWALKQEFRAAKNMIRHQIDDYARTLITKYSPEERAIISDIIEQEGSFTGKESGKLREAADEIIAWHKNIRGLLEDAGISTPTMDALGDKYLHRYYSVKVGTSLYRGMKAKMKSIVANYLKPRGQVRKVAEDGVREMGLAPEAMKVGDEFVSFTGGDLTRRTYVAKDNQTVINQRISSGSTLEPYKWQLEKVEGGVHNFRRDYSLAERETMGEVRDVAVRMAVLAREVSHDIALGHMFKEIKANPNWTFQAPAGMSIKTLKEEAKKIGWLHVPDAETLSGVKKFGALSDSFVHPDVSKVLYSMTSERQVFKNQLTNGLNELNKGILTPWKIGKTAFSPATHAFNIITNVAISFMAGHNPVSLMVDGGRELLGKGEYFTRAIQAGLLDSSIMKAEWDINSFIKLAGEIDVTKELQASAQGKYLEAFSKVVSPVTSLAKGALHTYSAEDEIFKLGLFMKEVKAGKSDKEALAAANHWFLNYSDVPRGVEFMRNTGIIPFISWSYKMVPVILNSIVEHPERLMGLVAAGKVFSDYHYEKEYGSKAQAQRNYEQALMEGTQQEGKTFYGIGPSALLRKNNDEQGNARFLDASHYLPGSDLMQDMFRGFPFGTHPLISMITALTMNHDPAFKKQIKPYEKPETPEQEAANTKGIVDFMVKLYLPNLPFIPGSFSHDKVGNALVASGVLSKETGDAHGWTGKDYLGDKANLSDALLSMVGVKNVTLNQSKTHDLRAGQAAKAIKDGIGEYIKAGVSPTTTDSELLTAESNARNVMDSRSKKIDRLDQLKKLTK